MTFIKLTYSTGSVYLNLDKVYSIEETSTADLTIYDANSILPVTYTFATAAERASVVAKLESIVRVIDIDALAKQQ
jgi:hypothetical protein